MAVTVREKKKGSGEWWVFINHKGKRRSKKIGSKKAANAVRQEVETRLAKGEFGFLKEKKPTLASFGEIYVDDPSRSWSANTRTNYTRLFRNHIKNHDISQMPLDEVAMHHVKGFIGHLNRKNLAKGSIQLITTILHGIFEEARVYEYVKMNPCARTGKFIVGNNEDEIDDTINAYTPKEAAEQIDRSKSLGLQGHAMVTFFTLTGARLGELLGLNWADINFENRTALISKQWNYRHKILGPTKTKRSREIDLTPYTVEVLKKLREETDFSRDSDPVFCTDEGERLTGPMVTGQFYKVRLCENMTLRGLRHTYATIRIAKGDNIIDVSRQLGHKKPSMTLDVYAEWLPRHHKGQVDELDSIHFSAPYTHPEPEKPITTH